jgi:radical SAM protein with 4Fe4S-binding SPASM domain
MERFLFIRRFLFIKQEAKMAVEDRYEKQAKESGLRYGIIEVTVKCQLRCPGCYMVRRNSLNGDHMSLAQAVRVLDLCRDFSGKELETMDILGGEPLLWPHLKDYLEALLRRGIKPWIFTNMLAITPKLAEWLYEREIHVTGKMNIGEPNDPVQLELQAEMIGSSISIARQLISGIEVFRRAGYGDPQFRLQNLIRKANIHLVPDYIRFCRSRGIGVDLELMGSGEPINADYWKVAPTPQELAQIIRQLDQQGKEMISVNDCLWPEFDNPVNRLLMPHVFGSCPFYDKGLYFGVDGHIRACSNSTQVLSRITDREPIRKAWESKLLHCRRQLTQENVGEPCHFCDRWEKCRGGCRATVEGLGNPFGGYPLCPLPFLQ